MIYYLPICFILALLGTLLVNIKLYQQLYLKRKAYKTALNEAGSKKAIYRSDYRVLNRSLVALIVEQALSFIVCFLASFLLLFILGGVTIRVSTIFAYLWIPAIAQYVNCEILSGKVSYFECDVEDSITTFIGFILIIFVAIPILIGCHKGIYNFLYPYDSITFMEENYKDIPSIDEAALLEKADLSSGSSLEDPIYRNGNWIYPVRNDSSHVASSGYLIVDSTGANISFVPKDIVYSPWTISLTNAEIVTRTKLPSVVFFGDTTFQINPEDGDVYFCRFYGDYACFRAGRQVEGVILINATSGECETHPIKEIPDWITGVSF